MEADTPGGTLLTETRIQCFLSPFAHPGYQEVKALPPTRMFCLVTDPKHTVLTDHRLQVLKPEAKLNFPSIYVNFSQVFCHRHKMLSNTL